MRDDSGVAGEGRVVGIPKFHSWGKCTMPLTNMNSDWILLFLYCNGTPQVLRQSCKWNISVAH